MMTVIIRAIKLFLFPLVRGIRSIRIVELENGMIGQMRFNFLSIRICDNFGKAILSRIIWDNLLEWYNLFGGKNWHHENSE